MRKKALCSQEAKSKRVLFVIFKMLFITQIYDHCAKELKERLTIG